MLRYFSTNTGYSSLLIRHRPLLVACEPQVPGSPATSLTGHTWHLTSRALAGAGGIVLLQAPHQTMDPDYQQQHQFEQQHAQQQLNWAHLASDLACSCGRWWHCFAAGLTTRWTHFASV